MAKWFRWTCICCRTNKRKNAFFDPQTGEKMVEYYFTRIQKGSTMICRIDNLTPTKLIEECCKGR